jgi:hypothetical protein
MENVVSNTSADSVEALQAQLAATQAKLLEAESRRQAAENKLLVVEGTLTTGRAERSDDCRATINVRTQRQRHQRRRAFHLR